MKIASLNKLLMYFFILLLLSYFPREIRLNGITISGKGIPFCWYYKIGAGSLETVVFLGYLFLNLLIFLSIAYAVSKIHKKELCFINFGINSFFIVFFLFIINVIFYIPPIIMSRSIVLF